MSEAEIILLKLLGVVALVLLNGFFVAAEFAIVKVRDTQLEGLVVRGHRRARLARRIIRNLDASLSATQLGITLASLGLGWFAEPVFAALLEPVLAWLNVESPEVRHSISFAVGFSVITFLHIVLGELAPKSLAIQKPMPTTLWIAEPLLWFHTVSFPFIWALNHTAMWVLRLVGVHPASEAELMHSEEELRLLLNASQAAHSSKLGRDLVLNAFDLKRRVIRDVMRPRKEIISLDTEAGISECLDVAEETRYSRFPLCVHGDLDQSLGVVHVKDLYANRLKSRRGADLAGVAKKIVFVPETARLERVLGLFLDRKLHFALVIDEYGATTGMLTLENILEELVGQIQDEFDVEKPLMEKKGEHLWELSGALPLHELSDLVGEPVTEEGVTTTNGLVTHRLGGFAKTGDRLVLGNYDLVVEETDGSRVTRLKLSRRAP